ncbi:MAG: endonuclease III [Magnetococcales bacterium]|nr:endonuclease III [Magnetococcales bacterium]
MIKKKAIEALFTTLRERDPEPQTELKHRTPYQLLVAVVLSAQATDVSVNQATPALFAKASTPPEMVKLGVDEIRNHIRTIGLFNNKAKNILALSQMLLDRFEGEVPQSREELESLPGVGRKSANVVLNVAFGQPTLAVDTHVFRVARRTGLAAAKSKTPVAVERDLLKVVPDAFLRHAHHWLILHGRYVCKARKPDCEGCSIHAWCTWSEKPPKAVG